MCEMCNTKDCNKCALVKTCWNCGNLSGDKTDHSDANPCSSCAAVWSFGIVALVPENLNVNWIPIRRR